MVFELQIILGMARLPCEETAEKSGAEGEAGEA
jgi:hypothetical protein